MRKVLLRLLLMGGFVLLAFMAIKWLWFYPKPAPAQDVQMKTIGEPVNDAMPKYDVQNFRQADANAPNLSHDKSFEELMNRVFGVASDKDATLDFNGSDALRYRYHANFEPPLYVIDSKDIFEISWYFASAKDSQSDKQISLNYAQKAYLFGDYLLDNPSGLFENMLNNTQSKQTDANGLPVNASVRALPDGVIFASCTNYMCQLIFDKNKLIHLNHQK